MGGTIWILCQGHHIVLCWKTNQIIFILYPLVITNIHIFLLQSHSWKNAHFALSISVSCGIYPSFPLCVIHRSSQTMWRITISSTFNTMALWCWMVYSATITRALSTESRSLPRWGWDNYKYGRKGEGESKILPLVEYLWGKREVQLAITGRARVTFIAAGQSNS